ncbi:MAG: DegV family protein [Lachnospiraceae bacterium]|nr:DegV family protein [Lachnospiraceae bacterium]
MMTRDYVIITDSTNDLPEEVTDREFVDIIPFIYELDGVTYGKENKISPEDYYEGMRQGKDTKTAAANIEEIEEHMTKALDSGRDVLFFCLSSGISSTLQNAYIARDDLAEKYPEAKICVFDSICASGGHGLLLWYAIKYYEEGLDAEASMKKLEETKKHIVHKFTVDDLHYLQRGGRISKASAVVGTMINIKPLLHVDDEGYLKAESKVRGRKKALISLVDSMEECLGSQKDNQEYMVICHSDCKEDADYVAGLMRERFHPKDIGMHMMTPTIGAHTGPGTMAIFGTGDKR